MVTFANNSLFPTHTTFTSEESWSPDSLTWRMILTVGLVGLASVIAYLFVSRLGVQAPLPVYLIGVVVTSAWFGAAYGVLSTACSITVCSLLFGSRPISFTTIAGANLAAAFVFVSTAMLVGVYADLARQRLGANLRLGNTDRNSVNGRHSDPNSELDQTPTFDWKGEGQNLAVAILMVVSACVLTVGLNSIFDIQPSLLFFVASVLITAITRGVRPAMVAAVLAVLASNAVSAGLHSGLPINKLGDLINLITLSAVAWWVGTYADHVRHGRQMAQVLFEAGQKFSTMSDELAIRCELLKLVADVGGISSIWLTDEQGKVLKSRSALLLADAVPTGALNARLSGKFDSPSPWRIWDLRIDDRPLGSLIWYSPKIARKETSVVDRVVTVLVDLGANAIARARLTAEQIDTQMLAQAEKLRTALLSSISHDFRTPLSGILGAATGLLEQGNKYDRLHRQDLLLNIRNQAVRLNRYIENLLSMMQLENGALKVKPKSLLIEPLIYDVWEALGDSGGSLRILDVRIQEDALIYADHFLFTQVLSNLFENAIKHTPEGSAVIVRGRTSGQSQLIEIVDAGPGIKDADLPHIFNRFYRGERPASVGLGLGLYISKALLETMSASIEVRNRADGAPGLIVSITIPVGENAR